MSILSFEFIFFFALVIISYYLVPIRWRWVHLLLSSIIFYGLISLPYLFLIIILTVIDFFIAKGFVLEKFKNRKKILLVSGLTANVLVLIFFKYVNPIYEFTQGIFIGSVSSEINPLFKIVIPLGISYYIFKKISYLVDVYRGIQYPEKNVAKLLLYVLFFPEITAGPIDRSTHLITQFNPKKEYDHQQILRGIQLILWGLFKKLVIADRLALLVNPVYNHPAHFNGPHFILATIFFSIQIYCDFSGYTDIVIGIGHTLGYRLMDNFNRPYFSKSISEFWTRWHISLSKWLRDYLFLPLAYSASRKIKEEKVLNISAESLSYSFGVLVTMSICGLWHGADSTFLFWGLLHGLYLTVSFFTRKMRKKIKRTLKINRFQGFDHFLRRIFCFSLVTFSWIFFRANSLGDGFSIVGKIFKWGGNAVDRSGVSKNFINGISFSDLVVVLLAIFLLFMVELLQPRIKFGTLILSRPPWQRWLIYYGIIFFILFFGVFESDVFIYEGF
ncbi:MAG: MBOAT family protein [Candidatus Aminicenantes bacterium]|nr:MBOAT family protein [Candidatus Aminicenantes bacterium]